MSPKPILFWAIDVLQPNRALRGRMIPALRDAQKALDADVVPIHVLSPTFSLVGSVLHAPESDEIKAAAKNRMLEYLEGVKVPRLAEPEIIEAQNGSLRGRALALLDAARARGAKLIVLATYSRKGVARFLMGSFAETLMTISDVPLLVVNPATRTPKGPILFASDLSDACEGSLPGTLALAKSARAPLVYFHHAPDPIQYLVEPMTSVTLYRTKVKESASLLRERVARRSERVSASGVRCRPLVSDKDESVPESILRAAKSTKAGLVVITTTKTPGEARILGSTARQVVRRSKCPVWVVHA